MNAERLDEHIELSRYSKMILDMLEEGRGHVDELNRIPKEVLSKIFGSKYSYAGSRILESSLTDAEILVFDNVEKEKVFLRYSDGIFYIRFLKNKEEVKTENLYPYIWILLKSFCSKDSKIMKRLRRFSYGC